MASYIKLPDLYRVQIDQTIIHTPYIPYNTYNITNNIILHR